MILVIAEKPSVAQTIAAVLGAKEKKDGFLTGSGYIVSWCVGHLVGLAEAAAYGEQYKKWSYDSLPILPQEWKYTVAADKEKQFKTLKELMHRADVSEVVNACDAGREGELIFRFVYEMAGCKKPMRRLWISSMEDSAIKEGFSRLKNGEEYDALFASALCRAKADWLIGINATRLFSVLYNHTLNVGRVQTPTLKMLVDRDAAITTFKKEKYYHVRLALSGAEAASEKLSDRSEADRLKAACEASKAVCTSLVKEKKTAAPPKLFDLTSLQREANRLFGYTAKQTLDLAQALYEKRLLTYPRTDSAFLTDDMSDTAAGIIKLLCGKFSFMAGKDFTPELGKVLNSKKVSDHHAIIPTMELAKTDLAALPESERNILTLAGARLLMATAAPHTFEAVTAVFECAGQSFIARGKTVLSDGWKEIDRRYRAALKNNPDYFINYAALIIFVSFAALAIPLAISIRKRNKADAIFRRFLLEPDDTNEYLLCEAVPAVIRPLICELGKHLRTQQEYINEQKITVTDYEHYVENWVHEIKKPLSLMTLLLDNRKDEMSPLVHTRMLYVRDHTRQDIEQILYFSRLGATHKDYSFESLSILGTCREAVEDNLTLLEEAGFSIEYTENDYQVISDKKGLMFILGQIISNSVKYVGNNLAPRLIFSIADSMNSEQISLSIKDNGTSIPLSDLPFVFDKGFTGDTGSYLSRSTGMGLYLVQKMATDLFITVELKNNSYGGTTVTLTFPKV